MTRSSGSPGAAVVTGTIVLQYIAFATAPLVAANAIAYAWPLLVAAWAALAPGGRGSRTSLAFAVIGFGGVVLLATGERLSALGLLGCGLIVLCAVGVVGDALPARPRSRSEEHVVPQALNT